MSNFRSIFHFEQVSEFLHVAFNLLREHFFLGGGGGGLACTLFQEKQGQNIESAKFVIK